MNSVLFYPNDSRHVNACQPPGDINFYLISLRLHRLGAQKNHKQTDSLYLNVAHSSRGAALAVSVKNRLHSTSFYKGGLSSDQRYPLMEFLPILLFSDLAQKPLPVLSRFPKSAIERRNGTSSPFLRAFRLVFLCDPIGLSLSARAARRRRHKGTLPFQIRFIPILPAFPAPSSQGRSVPTLSLSSVTGRPL